MGIGARDADRPRLQRLAQRIEHGTLEFRHYVANAPSGIRSNKMRPNPDFVPICLLNLGEPLPCGEPRTHLAQDKAISQAHLSCAYYEEESRSPTDPELALYEQPGDETSACIVLSPYWCEACQTLLPYGTFKKKA
jgi:hypothetical protein